MTNVRKQFLARLKKSVMSRLAPLGMAQRADLRNLIAQGIPEAEARAIAQGYGQVRKALPDEAAAGDSSAKQALLEELEALRRRIKVVQAEIGKASPLASEVHVPVPLGGRKKDYVLKAGDWDESKHPRADNGEFGSGSGGGGGDSKKPSGSGGGPGKSDAGKSSDDHFADRDAHRNAQAKARAAGDKEGAKAHGDAAKASQKKGLASLKAEGKANLAAIETKGHEDLAAHSKHMEAMIADHGAKVQAMQSEHNANMDKLTAQIAHAQAVHNMKMTAADARNDAVKQQIAHIDRAVADIKSGKYDDRPSPFDKGVRKSAPPPRPAPARKSASACPIPAQELAYIQAAYVLKTDWEEGKHPRADNGQFGSGSGGSAGSGDKPSGKKPSEKPKRLAKPKFGATRSGREVDPKVGPSNNKHAGFTSEDYADARQMHLDAAKYHEAKGNPDKQGEHEWMARAYHDQQNKAAEHEQKQKVIEEKVRSTPKLPSEQDEALRAYVNSSQGNTEVTAATMHRATQTDIQGSDAWGGMQQRSIDINKKVAQHLAEAIESHTSDQDQVLYRGLSLKEIPKPGETLATSRFSSFSESPGTAKSFMFTNSNSKEEGHHKVLFTADVPKGSHVLDVKKYLPADTGNLDETEHLFGPNQQFKVKDVKTETMPGGTPVVHVSLEAVLPGKKDVTKAASAPTMSAQEMAYIEAAYGLPSQRIGRPLDLQMALAAYGEAPADLAMASLINKSAGKPVHILKSDKMRQIVTGIVLTPEDVDTQGDWLTAHDIEIAAHNFLKQSRVIGAEHGKPIDASVVESYIAPQDLTFDSPEGSEIARKGTWLMSVHVADPQEWQQVLEDGFSGFSIGGLGSREDIAA